MVERKEGDVEIEGGFDGEGGVQDVGCRTFVADSSEKGCIPRIVLVKARHIEVSFGVSFQERVCKRSMYLTRGL